MLIVASNVAVGLLMDALTDIIRDVVNNIDVDVLVDVNANAFPCEMITFELAMPDP